MRIYLILLIALISACVNDPASSRPIAQETHVEAVDGVDLVEAVNRAGFESYHASSTETLINPLEVYSSNSISSDELKHLVDEIEVVSVAVGNGRKKWKGSFLSDDELSSSGGFVGPSESVLAEFSKVWSDRYKETDTYQYMEIAYGNSRMVADVFFPRDDFNNFATHFSYETYRSTINSAKELRAKVFIPLFNTGESNRVSLQSVGTKGRSIECGTFPEVRLNRPFIFVVRDPKTNVILFMGNVLRATNTLYF